MVEVVYLLVIKDYEERSQQKFFCNQVLTTIIISLVMFTLQVYAVKLPTGFICAYIQGIRLMSSLLWISVHVLGRNYRNVY